jgi:hypothetical protein
VYGTPEEEEQGETESMKLKKQHSIGQEEKREEGEQEEKGEQEQRETERRKRRRAERKKRRERNRRKERRRVSILCSVGSRNDSKQNSALFLLQTICYKCFLFCET